MHASRKKFEPPLILMNAVVQVLFKRTNGTVSHITAELRTEDRWRHLDESMVQATLDKLLEFRKDIVKDGLWYSHVLKSSENTRDGLEK